MLGIILFLEPRGKKGACCNCRLLFLGPETELVLAHVVVGAGLLGHLALSPVDRQLTEPVTNIVCQVVTCERHSNVEQELVLFSSTLFRPKTFT